MAIAYNKRDIKCSYNCFIQVLSISNHENQIRRIFAKNAKSNFDKSQWLKAEYLSSFNRGEKASKGVAEVPGFLNFL